MIRSTNWDTFVARHGVGDVLDGTVTRLVPFGVFVAVYGDIPGLLRTAARPAIGDVLPVRVTDIDPDLGRVAFSAA